MTKHRRRIAIVSHPWDRITLQTLIIGPIARYLARDWQVRLYGQRGPKQKRWETEDGSIELRRLTVFRRIHSLLEILIGIIAGYTKRRINYSTLPINHIFYALRVALSIKLSKCEVVLVFDFLQFAWIIKLLNPSATVCLYMHCEWLTDYATIANERRLHRVDLIIGCSDYVTEAIRKRFSAVAERCHTVHNGINMDLFRPSPDGLVMQDETDQLLYVGRLSPEKGVHVLIEAFKILVENHPRLRLHLVGAPSRVSYYMIFCPDWEDPAIATLERYYGIRLFDMVRRQLSRRLTSYSDDLARLAEGDERIVFYGGLPNHQTVDCYRRATMLVFPSLCNETFGMPPIEAMACGLPVVATHTGGIPETVKHGRTGILVPRGDARELARAIAQLLDDPERARAMGKAGRQRVIDRFTWDASVRRLVDLIERAHPAPGSSAHGVETALEQAPS